MKSVINFPNITTSLFLSQYWQKKPLVIPNAIPSFVNSLTADELAGLAMEEDMESRLVIENPAQSPQWHLKKGPFRESEFSTLPQTNWTLLVQGVDRVVPEVSLLLNHFDFIPQWRLDDVMISYATLYGSVGPHYDNYDVFLYQAQGRRKWSLTSKNCHPDNYINDLELRIMKSFDIEEEYILEEGDMLYLPAHIGHYGISLSEECMTYSFGYRSYPGQEIWDSLGDYLAEHSLFQKLYRDPDWSTQKESSLISPKALQQAKHLMQELLDDESLLLSWFGCFATRMDQQAEYQLSMPLEEDELPQLSEFIHALKTNELVRDPCCRFAYAMSPTNAQYQFFINGKQWNVEGVCTGLLELIANNRHLSNMNLLAYLDSKENQSLLYELYQLQWLHLG